MRPVGLFLPSTFVTLVSAMSVRTSGGEPEGANEPARWERPGHTRRCATVASFRTWRGSRPRVVPTTSFLLDSSVQRRGWDSNPRYPFIYTRVPGVRLQPLGHLSSERRA